MRSRLSTLLLSALTVAIGAFGASTSAQCFTSDGLTSTCCTTVTPTLPSFPARFESGLGVCWNACNPGPTTPLRVSIAAPALTGCTTYSTSIKVDDGTSGASLLAGTVELDYTRTWFETTAPPFPNSQVWRFVAKADLSPPSGTASTTCPVPSCLFGHPTAFFYGYVDFSLDCATGTWSSAIVLYHACDWFIHDQAFSDKPGTFHPGTSYGIIAPNDPGNPFVPGTLAPPAGPLVAEAVRGGRPVPPLGLCVAEEFVSGGVLNSLASICVCPFTPTPAQHTAQAFNGLGSCPGAATGTPSSFAALNTIGFGLPWLYLMTTSLGSWTTAASYPGPEAALVNEGLVFYHDACAEVPGLSNGNSFDVLYGATTVGGYMPVPDGIVPITDKFVDVASNFSLPLGTPPVPPFVGSVRPTDHLIYVNVP